MIVWWNRGERSRAAATEGAAGGGGRARESAPRASGAFDDAGSGRGFISKPASRRSAWVDPRFVVGTALVVASIVGVSVVVSVNDDTIAVYAVDDTLVRGAAVDVDDLVVAHVRLDRLEGGYVEVGALPVAPLVAVRTVGAGELLPVEALGDGLDDNGSSVVVEVAGPLPAAVVPGSVVQLWAGAVERNGVDQAAPAVIVEEATVETVSEADGFVGASASAVSVELRVPRDDVAVVLGARSIGSTIAIIAVDRAVDAGSGAGSGAGADPRSGAADARGGAAR